MWWKKNKWKIMIPVLIVAVLAAAFWYGGSAPGLQGWTAEAGPAAQAETPVTNPSPAGDALAPASGSTENPPAAQAEGMESSVPASVSGESGGDVSGQSGTAELPEPEYGRVLETPAGQSPEAGIDSRPGGTEGGMTAQEKVDAAAEIAGGSSAGVTAGGTEYSESQGMVIDPAAGKDQYLTDPVPEGRPLPVEPRDAEISDTACTCTLSISCAAILDHMDWLDPEKVELVPEDGWILKPTEVTFYEGESVFNVLQRTCKQQSIHMEFENTPMYNSAYIEGIHNLYEFDCGELSGWMYQVNGWFPNYGCSRYQLQDGDVVEWVYTCDMGVDVGGFYFTGN